MHRLAEAYLESSDYEYVSENTKKAWEKEEDDLFWAQAKEEVDKTFYQNDLKEFEKSMEYLNIDPNY